MPVVMDLHIFQSRIKIASRLINACLQSNTFSLFLLTEVYAEIQTSFEKYGINKARMLIRTQ